MHFARRQAGRRRFAAGREKSARAGEVPVVHKVELVAHRAVHGTGRRKALHVLHPIQQVTLDGSDRAWVEGVFVARARQVNETQDAVDRTDGYQVWVGWVCSLDVLDGGCVCLDALERHLWIYGPQHDCAVRVAHNNAIDAHPRHASGIDTLFVREPQ